jgi:N-methylhydantoinase A
LPTLTPETAPADLDPAPALKLHRRVYYSELQDYARTPVYDGDRVRPGMKIVGPAVVERMGDTIVLPTFANATVDGFGNIVITLNDRRGEESV